MQITISDFKAHCTGYLKSLPDTHNDLIITRRGKAIAIVKKPAEKNKDNPLYGCLKGNLLHISDDFDAPLGDSDWEATR